MKLKSDYSLTTRNDFNPVYVLSAVEAMPPKELRRVLAEACHRIVMLENKAKVLVTIRELVSQ